jgi:hypothetical protein
MAVLGATVSGKKNQCSEMTENVDREALPKNPFPTSIASPKRALTRFSFGGSESNPTTWRMGFFFNQ